MKKILLGLGLLGAGGGVAAWLLGRRPEHEQLPPPGPASPPPAPELAAAAEPRIRDAAIKAHNLMVARSRAGLPVYAGSTSDPFWDLAWKAQHGREIRLIFLAARTGLSPRTLDAVMQVESGGRRADLVRFEPHRFLRVRPDLQGQIPYHPSETDPNFVGKRDDLGPWSYRKSEVGREAFDRAAALDPGAAVDATSFGSYQVLGWGLFPEGGGDPKQALAAFDRDPAAVSDRMLVRWIEANPEAKAAAREQNWLRFARIYNGDGKARSYAEKLMSAWQQSDLPIVV